MADDDIRARLRHFQRRHFPRFERTYKQLIDQGQHPTVLFIGCCDSRIVPYLLLDAGPGELFVVRNVGNLVPPHAPALDPAWPTPYSADGCGSPAETPATAGAHGTAAAIEFAVLVLKVRHIVICGHSHCGAMRALYETPPPAATHLRHWLKLAEPAVLPVTPTAEALHRVEQRNVIVQLERLYGYPLIRESVERGELFLHGWHYIIEEGRILVLNVKTGEFEAAETPPPADIDAYRLQ